MDLVRRFLGVSASTQGLRQAALRGPIALASPPEDSVPAELDVDAAINAHERWKARLMDYLEGRLPVGLDPDVIRRDDYSALGRWLHGRGRRRVGPPPCLPFADGPAPLLSRTGCRDGAMAQQGSGTMWSPFSRPPPVCFEPDRALLKSIRQGLAQDAWRSVSAASKAAVTTAWRPAAVM